MKDCGLKKDPSKGDTWRMWAPIWGDSVVESSPPPNHLKSFVCWPLQSAHCPLQITLDRFALLSKPTQKKPALTNILAGMWVFLHRCCEICKIWLKMGACFVAVGLSPKSDLILIILLLKVTHPKAILERSFRVNPFSHELIKRYIWSKRHLLSNTSLNNEAFRH